jgi:hypothetical protein
VKGFVDFYSRNTRQVQAAIDQTEYELRENMGPLDALFPVTTYPATELLLLKMQGDITVASIVAPDQELPNDPGSFKLTEEVLGRTLIGKQHVFTDKEYEMLNKMQTYLAAGGPQANAVITATEQYLYGTAAEMPMAINAKHLILLMEVMSTGACDYTDPLTGLRVQMTYNDRVNALFPAALTDTDRWGQSGTADGLANLELISEAWRSIHGSKPSFMLAHYDDLRALANQESTKEAAAANATNIDAALANSLYLQSLYDPTSLQLTPGPLLDLIRQRAGVERVLVVDRKYTERNSAGVESKKFFLPEHTIIFGDPDGMYERARVPFKENNWQPGVFVRTKELSDAPLRERIAGMTAGVPFVRDGRYLCAQVIDGAI